MSCIRYLWIADYDNITEAGWAHLQQMKNLQSLRLKNCGVTDSVMRFMPPNLTELNIGCCKNLTDQFLTDASKMFPRLTILNMEHCTWVSGESVAPLSSLPIKQLNLSHTAVTDKSVASLSSLPITQLDLSYTAVTDKSVAILSSLPITQLDLSRTAVTDSCVDSILSMSLLEQVCLEYCKNISEMAVRRLKGKLVRDDGEFYDEDDISDWEENRACWNWVIIDEARANICNCLTPYYGSDLQSHEYWNVWLYINLLARLTARKWRNNKDRAELPLRRFAATRRVCFFCSVSCLLFSK